MQQEICENCHKVIGALETPQVWNDKIVCHDCKSKLPQSGNCPACSSNKVQKVSIAYEQGTQSSNSTSMHVAITNDDIVPIFGGSSGTSQSLLAQRLAPPVLETNFSSPEGRLLVIALLFVIAISIGIFLIKSDDFQMTASRYLPTPSSNQIEAHEACVKGIWICISFAFIFFGIIIFIITQWNVNKQATRNRSLQHKKSLENWNKQWVCHKCGKIFT